MDERNREHGNVSSGRQTVSYLVMRREAIRPKGVMRHSDYWPMVVEINPCDMPLGEEYEYIVRKALDRINEGYVPIGKQYVVVPFDAARLITFRPKHDYEVSVEHFS